MELGTLRGSENVQYVKMGHVPKVAALDENTWDLEQAVRETEKNFSTDLQLLMTEATNDPTLLKTLVSLEQQQHELIPEKYQIHKGKLSSLNIKTNIPSTEINSLRPLDNPNEEIQMDFIGPMTENNRRFHILLSMDRYS